MSTQLAVRENQSAVPFESLEKVLIKGDLSSLTQQERYSYYLTLCQNLGLNPNQNPFSLLELNGKLVLYANKSCAEQLRLKYGITCEIKKQFEQEGILYIEVRASLPSGRFDDEIGFATIKGLYGDKLGNAHLKALTKAKRRATLSICGLGFMDETEVDSIEGAKTRTISEKGEIENPSHTPPQASQAPVKPIEASSRPIQPSSQTFQPSQPGGATGGSVSEVNPHTGQKLASHKQINWLRTEISKAQIPHPEMANYIRTVYSLDSIEGLDWKQFKQLIEIIQKGEFQNAYHQATGHLNNQNQNFEAETVGADQPPQIDAPPYTDAEMPF